MSHTNLRQLIFETRGYYVASRPADWVQLADIAEERLLQIALPFRSMDVTIYYGSHVAMQEEISSDRLLWQGLAGAIALACRYGVVLKKAVRCTDSADFRYTLDWLSRLHMPIPSAQAIVQSACILKLELKLSDHDLRLNLTQKLPYLSKPRLLRNPDL